MSDAVSIPEWLATLVGRLIIENEALRLTAPPDQPPVRPAA